MSLILRVTTTLSQNLFIFPNFSGTQRVRRHAGIKDSQQLVLPISPKVNRTADVWVVATGKYNGLAVNC
jgi:hypothetical protein